MNIEDLFYIERPGAVVAHCTMLSESKVSMSMTTCDFYTTCEDCHQMKGIGFTIDLTIDEFKKKINEIENLSCILFFDNFPFDEYSTSSAEALLYFLAAAYNSDSEINVCLYSSRKNIPEIMNKYLTKIKCEVEDGEEIE